MTFNLRAVPDREALLSMLRRIDLTVAGRTRGRTKQQTETWTICRLLSTLAQTDRLAFPITAIHQDRPDISIQMANMSIGVEITEAISEQFAEFSALAMREYPNALLEFAHFRWDSPKRTVPEMRALLSQSRLTSDGWAGDDPEREWAAFIQSAVNKKLDRLAVPEFTKFDQNWLAIYDNLPLPHINLASAIVHLRPLLENCWNRQPNFDALLVEHDSIIVEITPHGSALLALNDIWGRSRGGCVH
jgi:hypothetical protein